MDKDGSAFMLLASSVSIRVDQCPMLLGSVLKPVMNNRKSFFLIKRKFP